MLIGFQRGQTSVVLRVLILDSSVLTGAGLAGLDYDSTGLIISTIADNEASATAYAQASSDIETISTLGTFAAPTSGKCRFKEVDSTNHPGVYEIQIADSRFAVSSSKSLLVSITGAEDQSPCHALVPLTDINPYDSVRAGLTAIPNVSSGSAGAIVTSGAGTAQISLSSGAVTVGTNNDKLGYGLADDAITADTFDESTAFPVAAADTGSTALSRVGADSDTLETLSDQIDSIADAVLDEALSGHATSGTLGKAIADILTDTGTTIPETLGTPSGSSLSADIAAIGGGGGDATASNQSTIIGHLTDIKGATFSGSTDSLEAIRDRGDAAWTGSGSASDIADAVLDEALSGHVTAGTLGKAISDLEAGSSIVPWADIQLDGTSGDNAFVRVWAHDGGLQRIDIEDRDASATATVTVREYLSGVETDVFTETFDSDDFYNGGFEKTHASPGLEANKLYVVEVSLTVDSTNYTNFIPLPVGP